MKNEINKTFDCFIDNAGTDEMKQLIEEIKKMYNEKERLKNIINELLEFIKDSLNEEAINNSFNMTTKEFIEYIKNKLIGEDKE